MRVRPPSARGARTAAATGAGAGAAADAAARPPRTAAAPPSLRPSRQFAVTVDGATAFVYLATTDGSRVHNGSFVLIPLHPGASREVVVTLLEPL
jgi:uncharacterized membrane protein